MRIDATRVGLESPDPGQTGRTARTATSQAGASEIAQSNNSGEDNARLSFDFARVQSLEASVLAQPEIREAKVQSLRQAIDLGHYSIPASQITDALVSEFSGAQG